MCVGTCRVLHSHIHTGSSSPSGELTKAAMAGDSESDGLHEDTVLDQSRHQSLPRYPQVWISFWHLQVKRAAALEELYVRQTDRYFILKNSFYSTILLLVWKKTDCCSIFWLKTCRRNRYSLLQPESGRVSHCNIFKEKLCMQYVCAYGVYELFFNFRYFIHFSTWYE